MDRARLFLVQVWRNADGFRGSALLHGDDEPRWFDSEATMAAYLGSAVGTSSGPAESLSSRESEVAMLFAAGSNHKRIAQRLGLAPATVRNHLSACYRKLGVDNRVALLSALATPRERRAAVMRLHHGPGLAELPDSTADKHRLGGTA